MPLKDFLDKFEHDPTTFDFDAFKKAVADEYDVDTGLYNARVSQLSKTQEETAAKLEKAQSRAWELMNEKPADQDPATGGVQPDPDDDPTNVKIEDLFTKEDRKK